MFAIEIDFKGELQFVDKIVSRLPRHGLSNEDLRIFLRILDQELRVPVETSVFRLATLADFASLKFPLKYTFQLVS